MKTRLRAAREAGTAAPEGDRRQAGQGRKEPAGLWGGFTGASALVFCMARRGGHPVFRTRSLSRRSGSGTGPRNAAKLGSGRAGTDRAGTRCHARPSTRPKKKLPEAGRVTPRPDAGSFSRRSGCICAAEATAERARTGRSPGECGPRRRCGTRRRAAPPLCGVYGPPPLTKGGKGAKPRMPGTPGRRQKKGIDYIASIRNQVQFYER